MGEVRQVVAYAVSERNHIHRGLYPQLYVASAETATIPQLCLFATFVVLMSQPLPISPPEINFTAQDIQAHMPVLENIPFPSQENLATQLAVPGQINEPVNGQSLIHTQVVTMFAHMQQRFAIIGTRLGSIEDHTAGLIV